MTLPNTEQLRTALESLGGCDSIAGPVLQMVGVVFAAQAAQAQAQKEITRFVKDIERTRQTFNDEDFREKFSEEIDNLNIFDEAFKTAMEGDLSSLMSNPFGASQITPDSFRLQNIGGFGMFSSGDLSTNTINKFNPLSLMGERPGGECNAQGVGSLGGVQFPGLSSTTERFRKASSSLAGIGMTFANDPTRALDMATISAGELSKNFVFRATLLEDLNQSVDILENLLIQLGDREYDLRFDEVIADAKAHIDQAIFLVEGIIDDLSASGSFQQSEKEELKDELQEAADALTIPDGFPEANGFFIFMYVQSILVVMDQQLRLLKELDSQILITLPNLSSFTTNLTANFSLSNHYGGMFSVIRCGLKDISDQMSRAQRSGDIIAMVSLIPRWRILVLMYRQMVDVAAQDPLPPIENSIQTSDFGARIGDVEQQAAEALDVINQEAMDDVIAKVRSFMSIAETKLKANIAFSAVEARGAIARDALEQAISEQTSIQGVLDQFIGDSPEEKERAEALYTVIEATPYLYGVGNALATGDWGQFFSADALESSSQALLGKYLAAAGECAAESNDVAAEAIRREADRQIQESRLEDVSRNYVYDVSSRMQSLGITEIILMKSRLKRIQALLRLPVFGGSFPARDVFAP